MWPFHAPLLNLVDTTGHLGQDCYNFRLLRVWKMTPNMKNHLRLRGQGHENPVDIAVGACRHGPGVPHCSDPPSYLRGW